MTDAERIAGYLKRCGLSDGNWPDCARILRYDGDDFTDESCYGVVKHLAAMLSDVRREERKAWEEVLDEEIRASVVDGELIASSRLARIKICMKVRGSQ